jgi:DHA2 family metal-tetracycline-proton antiporter-like MFS transporter
MLIKKDKWSNEFSKLRNMDFMTILLILAVSMAVFSWSFSAGTVTIGLPLMSQYLDISTSMASWIVVIHLLILTSFLLIFGRLGDILGAKKIFLTGVFVFTMGSYLSGVSIEFYQLLLSRALQGLGSAMLLSLAPAIISQHVNQNSQAKAFAAISVATTIALAFGYGIGGYAITYLDWNFIFLITVPMGIISFFMGYFFIPQDSIKSQKNYLRSEFDIVGAFLVLIFLISFILSIYGIQNTGLISLNFIMHILISLALFIILFKWESNQKKPILDIKLLKNPSLFFPILVAFMMTFVLMGTIFIVPFYLDLIMGYDPSFAGMLILVPALLVLFVGPFSGYITDRFGSKTPTLVSTILLLFSLLVFVFADEQIGFLLIVLALAGRSVSEGLFSPSNNKQIMKHGEIHQKGSVSSLLNTSKYMGIIMGVVIFGAVFEGVIIRKTSNLAGVPLNGAVHFTAPMPILLNAFQETFLMGALISFFSIILVLFFYVWEDN